MKKTTKTKEIISGLQKSPLLVLRVDMPCRSFRLLLDAVCARMAILWKEAVSADGELFDTDKLLDFAGLFVFFESALRSSGRVEYRTEYPVSQEIYEYYRMTSDELGPLLDEALSVH